MASSNDSFSRSAEKVVFFPSFPDQKLNSRLFQVLATLNVVSTFSVTNECLSIAHFKKVFVNFLDDFINFYYSLFLQWLQI